MTTNDLTRRTALKLACAAGTTLVGSGVASGNEDVDSQAVNELREATAQYHDPSKAVEDGYARDDRCVAQPEGNGVMGFHYLDVSRIDGTRNRTEPEVLVYERRGSEDHLVAVEFLSTASAGEPAPSVFGHDMHPAPHLPFANWELHVWCWKPNPRGLFANYNPRVECPGTAD